MVQASTLPNLEAIDPSLILLDEKLSGGAYWHYVIKRGNTLRVTDLEGSYGVSIICYNADSPIERLNIADTAKIQFNAFLKKGMVIYSDMGRILFSITEDTSGHHDLICGCSNAASNAAKYGEGTYNKYGESDYNNSRNNFLKALGKRGLTRKDLMPNLNLFSRVAVHPNGDLEYVTGNEKPGSFIDLRAEMNVLVIISNCPHVLHPDTVYKPKPIQLTVWKSSAPAPDDLCRTANEEVIRGFINTDALFAQD
ncbi:urea carboxylase-associated family protein [Nostoc flagelliforme FACHB-838]|uniref:Urea carboxylase-associated family protein n=1 Tax=Nostoc flagelliforme FACHB-838 TaxID=2692904 RepID=A0ABR8DTM9_9NOSO|nr:urea amidolyase associated protein UAAP1 [Nostoc flagelliforme]MBD2532802.1 urea carboxylase-associated family protein [Nostoc flagelliforme FACHB-838]